MREHMNQAYDAAALMNRMQEAEARAEAAEAKVAAVEALAAKYGAMDWSVTGINVQTSIHTALRLAALNTTEPADD